MSTRPDGGVGRKGREAFLSAHRCPEVDLLPRHNSETAIHPPGSLFVPSKKPEFTCRGQSEANYLEVSSTPCRDEEGEEDETISDWSEEDLSLHFSPSVILPSDDEESDLEATFECVDIIIETLVNGQEGEGPKMVPKRQIQLKKKDERNIVKDTKEELQVADGPAAVDDSEVSGNEMLCPISRHRPDLLLRQHSMPASLHTHSATTSDVESHRVYRGLVAGASQGFHVEGNTKQRLQKSLSLDETKTKMASCIIKSVLSKKMQAEQNHSKTSNRQKKAAVVPSLQQPTDQQKVGDGGGGEKGGGVPKAPVHVVRDIRSLIKNTYGLSFSAPHNNKPSSSKVIGREGSPPPTYQQAVGVKGHDETKSSIGHVKRVTASLAQSQCNNQSNNRPITQQGRGSEPIINRSKNDDVIWPAAKHLPPKSAVRDPLELSKSERVASVSHQEWSSLPPSEVIQPLCPPSKSRPPEEIQPLVSSQEQSSLLGVSSHFAPSSSQQIFPSCFYTTNALPAFPPTLSSHMGKVSYVHGPLSYIQTQLQPTPPGPTLHFLRRSEENQSRFPGNTSDQQDHSQPHQTKTSEDQKNNGNIATQEHHEQQQLQQQQFMTSAQGLLPAKVGSDQSSATSGALPSDPVPWHMLDPKNVQCFYVDMPPQSQRKMLLDPETGQYVQVFLPAPNSTPNSNTFPVSFANAAPFTAAAMKPTPAVLSVMQFQPAIVSSLYAPPFLPFSLHTPAINFTHTTL